MRKYIRSAFHRFSPTFVQHLHCGEQTWIGSADRHQPRKFEGKRSPQQFTSLAPTVTNNNPTCSLRLVTHTSSTSISPNLAVLYRELRAISSLSTTMSALKPDVFIPALNTDVLTIIFEELLNSADIPCDQPNCWDSFLSLRLLSKQLDDIVVRVGFRQIVLGSGILECFKTFLQVCCQMTLEQSWYRHTPETIQAQLGVAGYTRTYTRHILFDEEGSNLDWSWVPDMLTSLGNLTHITYVLPLSLSLSLFFFNKLD